MRDRLGSGQEAKSGSQRLSVPGLGLLVGFQAAIVRVLPQGFPDPRRPCPGENMRFFNPLAVAFAVDTVISVNRIFLSVIGGRKPTDIEIEQRIGRQDIARYEKMMREEPGRYWSS